METKKLEDRKISKIFDKFLKNIDAFESIEKTSTITIYSLAGIYCIIQSLYLCYFIIQDIPEMILANAISVAFCLLNLYSLKNLKNLTLGLSLWVVNSCFCMLVMTYVLGYNKNAVAFVPVLLLLMYFIFPKKKKYLRCNTVLVIITYFVILYMKYHVVSKYNNSFGFIEVINTFAAIMLAVLIIHLKAKSDELVEMYNSKQVQVLSEKVEELTNEANIDFLTGIWNRRYAEVELPLEEFVNSYIVFADIDSFEQVNTEYGNLTGDYILIEIANYLKSSFRNKDVVCRWVGEEFLIILRDAKHVDVTLKLEKIRTTIENTDYEFNDNKFNITMTFGYAKFDTSISLDENAEKAHSALQNGKNTGKNCLRCFVEESE